MTQAAQDHVHYFWPEARIEALRAYAADEHESADTFAKSKRMAWMREFCMEAPSWLQTAKACSELRETVGHALMSSRAVTHQLEGALRALDAMCAPPSTDGQDKWAKAIAAVAPAERPEPAAKPRMKQVDWVPLAPLAADKPPSPLSEAVAEADPMPAERPVAVAKMPANDQQLPAEAQWDAAHGKPPGTSKFRASLDKLPPDARARVLGHAYAKAWGPSDTQLHMRRRAAEIAQSIKDDPAAWEEPKDKAPVKKAKRAPRTHSRVEIGRIAKKHGDEVATFVAHILLKDQVSTRGLRQRMERFMGTFASRTMASSHCATHYKVLSDFYGEVDVLGKYAEGRYLEHEDGRCSWWRA